MSSASELHAHVLGAIRGESLRYRRYLELSLEQVGDDAFFAADEHGNSMAIVVSHLAGNLRSRFTDFLTTDGEKPWRNRDGEFEDPRAEGRPALEQRMLEAWGILDAALDEVDAEGALMRDVTIRKVPLTVCEALQRSLSHVAYHVGQIVQSARAAAGDDWQTLSVPKGGSAAYAANPTRERSPDGR